jgi:hypothetical protein
VFLGKDLLGRLDDTQVCFLERLYVGHVNLTARRTPSYLPAAQFLWYPLFCFPSQRLLKMEAKLCAPLLVLCLPCRNVIVSHCLKCMPVCCRFLSQMGQKGEAGRCPGKDTLVYRLASLPQTSSTFGSAPRPCENIKSRRSPTENSEISLSGPLATEFPLPLPGAEDSLPASEATEQPGRMVIGPPDK